VDLEKFVPPARSTARSARPITIGALANLRPEKGLEDLVRAAALVLGARPDVRFVLWGEGPMRTSLERLIARLQLVGRVELPGPTATPEAALRALDIFVLPSHSEASSNALLEAMATGLPIVATRVGGTVKLVEHQRTGLLVPPGDPAALAQAIGRLLDDPGLSDRFRAEARAAVCSRFAPAQMLTRLEHLYDTLLGIVPRPAATTKELHACPNVQTRG
jgi:glycosyltransferase involved in cell wall biosynthesis